MLELVVTKKALSDLKYWQKSKPKIYKKILNIIQEARLEPFGGLAKPEPLRYNFSGYWSKRINREHRIVYEVVGTQLIIHQCRYHY